MRRSSTLERIVAAFAEAVEAGDFAGAEGWFSLARDNADRTALRDARARRAVERVERVDRSPRS